MPKSNSMHAPTQICASIIKCTPQKKSKETQPAVGKCVVSSQSLVGVHCDSTVMVCPGLKVKSSGKSVTIFPPYLTSMEPVLNPCMLNRIPASIQKSISISAPQRVPKSG